MKFICVLLGMFVPILMPIESHARLSVEHGSQGQPILTYQGHPVFAYGPSPQNLLTYLPKGNGNDYKDWLAWAIEHRISNVRSYPPSLIVYHPATNLFLPAPGDKKKFDLTRFNPKYFEELRKACKSFKENGVIVHLQLWQGVAWKKFWNQIYYNPVNNINPDIAAHASPGQFVTLKNPVLLSHQKEYVRHILDATGDLGNVFYDIMNEIGNGTGTSEQWVLEIISEINAWEKEKGIDVLLTLNDEGGRRMGRFSLECDGLDLIVIDLGKYEEHIEVRRKYGKPTISVRNIDFNYESGERTFFFSENDLEINTDDDLQTRGRKYWWRMYMAGVASAAGYADTIEKKNYFISLAKRASERFGFAPPNDHMASYRLNNISEENFNNFRNFIKLAGHPSGFTSAANIVAKHPAENSYILQNADRAIVYIESPNGNAGHWYPSAIAQLQDLLLPDGTYDVVIYYPASGKKQVDRVDVRKGGLSIRLPEFKDDLALLIQRETDTKN